MRPVLAALALLWSLALPALAQDVAKPVKLMELSAEPVTLKRQFFGQVQARQTVDLAFQVGGQIELLEAEEGARLSAGSVIARLDLDGFERAVAQARAGRDKAVRDVERLRALSGQAASAVQVRDAETQLQLADIALGDAQDALEHATLTAPFDALVARRLVANYASVSAGTPVVRLHDVSEIRVDIEVPEVLFRQAGAGAGDRVRFSAELPGESNRYALALREFETETSSLGQTYTITLAFTESPGAFVFPGASVTVFAAAEGARPDGVILPETALVYDAAGAPFVMVFEDGTVRRAPVSIAVQQDGRIHMTDGPAEGTRIVSTGAAQLSDGQTVRPFTRIGE